MVMVNKPHAEIHHRKHAHEHHRAGNLRPFPERPDRAGGEGDRKQKLGDPELFLPETE